MQGSVVVAALMSLPGLSRAQCESTRPSDPNAAWSYGDVELAEYVAPNGAFRIWYAIRGAHAPDDVETASSASANARMMAEVGEQAHRFFHQELGFEFAAPDTSSSVCSELGDGLVDVYLFDFPGADGTIGYDACVEEPNSTECSGFILIENDFQGASYANFEQAAKTVLPHEYFHLVQGRYSRSIAAWWAEGTAQWVTKQLYPELSDLEAYLPAFFERVGRPLDLPPSTAAQPYSYGAALFAQFLGEAYSPDVVREVFEVLARSGGTELEAIDEVLRERDSQLSEAFAQFALWNAATGGRARPGQGYSAAATYPEVPAPELTGSVSGATAGLSANYYLLSSGTWRVEFEANLERSAAWAIPVEEAGANLDAARPLPARVEAPALVVVVGLDTNKSDAAYTLQLQAPDAAQPSDAGCADCQPSPEAEPEVSAADLDSESGCHLAPLRTDGGSAPLSTRALVLFGLGVLMLRTRKAVTGRGFGESSTQRSDWARLRWLALGVMACALSGCGEQGSSDGDPPDSSHASPDNSLTSSPSVPSPAPSAPSTSSTGPGSPSTSATPSASVTPPAPSGESSPGTPSNSTPSAPTQPLPSGSELPSSSGGSGGFGGAGPTNGAGAPSVVADAGAAGEMSSVGGAGGAAPAADEWLPAWATSIQKIEQANLPPPLADATLRQYIWPSYSGDEVRIQLSNEKGAGPVELTKVHLAAPGQAAGQIDPATDAEFTFEGEPGVTIPAGQTVWSDALSFPLRAGERTAISMHFQSVPEEITGHPGSRMTSYIGSGDTVSAAALSDAETRDRWYFINALEVMAPPDAFAVSLLGDSITDGYGVLNAFERWPDFLTAAIQADADLSEKVSVLNAGMGANALLTSTAEQDSGLIRFERDVLGRAKVKWLIVLIGVNDIGGQSDLALVDQVTGAYQQIIEQSHEAGILVYGSPITPFKGNSYDAGQALTLRNQINEWVLSSGAFDAVIRLDQAVADPADADRLLPMYSNDGLHPNVAGYRAMGNAVDLTLFSGLAD